jgi:aminobenzoyl-glutamate utilization protein B
LTAGQVPDGDTTGEERYALGWIDERPHFSDFHVRIWKYAEPTWHEYKSARAYCDLLRAEGFAVEEGSGGMPTAFCARWAPPARC